MTDQQLLISAVRAAGRIIALISEPPPETIPRRRTRCGGFLHCNAAHIVRLRGRPVFCATRRWVGSKSHFEVWNYPRHLHID